MLAVTLAAALVPLLGPGTALHGTGEGSGPGAGTVALLRTVMFLALSVHLGGLATAHWARRTPGAPDGPLPAAWPVAASAAGLAAAFGLASIVSTGNLLPQQWADLDLGGLYRTRDGLLALIEVNAFAAAALCATTRRPGSATLPLAAVIVAEALRAHPEMHSPLVGSAMTLLHLSCAALWTGGLLHVVRTVRQWRRRAPRAAAALLGRYARVALGLFAVLTATGIVSTLRRLPPDAVTSTAYGRTLTAKLLLVGVVAVLALLARRRLHTASDPASALVPARTENLVLVVVVALSALLTAVPVPVFW